MAQARPTFDSEGAVYDAETSAPAHENAQALSSLVLAIRASDLGEQIALLRAAMERVDPIAMGVRVLWLVEALSGRPLEPVKALSGTIEDYVQCLKNACRIAGGDGSTTGCHCNPWRYGWKYCSASAAIYLMESQRCWWEHLSPFPIK